MDEDSEKLDALAARIKQADTSSRQGSSENLAVASSSRVGIDFAGSVIGAGIIGGLLDRAFSTFPWCLLGMVIFGFVVGTWNAWRSMKTSDSDGM